MQDTVRFVFDDCLVEIEFSESSPFRPTTTLLNYLRSFPAHKGVKEGCAEGDCGACTVVLAEIGDQGKLVYRTVDSCLVFLPMIHGKQLITVENLAFYKEKHLILHPVQKMMVEANGSQCGYCTSGVVMSIFGLFKNHQNPSRETIEDALTGNLCRCTGYQSILEAAQKACSDNEKDHFSQYEQGVIGMLKEIAANNKTVEYIKGKQHYIKPFTLADALKLRRDKPGAVIVNGSTDVALRQTKKRMLLPLIIDLSGITGLQQFREEKDCYVIGAGLTLERLKSLTRETLPALFGMLKVFGSLQIRNTATLGGNIGSASPIGDLLPLLIAYRALIRLQSISSERKLVLEDFITGYRQTNLEEDELITEIIIPKYDVETTFFSHKVSRRKDMDISTVNAGFRLKLKQGIPAEIILAFGGLSATPKRAFETERFLKGKPWDRITISQAMEVLDLEFTPISDVRADAEFRKSAGRNLLMKFFLETSTHTGWMEDPAGVPVKARAFRHISHESAEKHVTGESVFIEDLMISSQLLQGKVVYSKQAHAMIRRIDIAKALLVPGVRSILTANDIPGENQMGPVIHDEPCLAEKEVTFIGQAIALIAVETEDAGWEAEKLITIEFDPLPTILD
ncbi:MAG: xanthine dehydrogenase small subunit, partial [Bacteroidota bacterium]